MLKLYSPRRADRVLRRCAPQIRQAARLSGVPIACIQAILYKELTDIDLLDPVADLAVRLYWLRWRLRGKGDFLPKCCGFFGKRDSSTGYGQIFAYVAINAANFALDRGLVSPEALGFAPGTRPDAEKAEDLCAMWLRLHREPADNILFTALNLLAAAGEMTGHTRFEDCSAQELKLIFTRYNADTRQVTPYGETAYRLYLRFRANQAETVAV